MRIHETAQNLTRKILNNAIAEAGAARGRSRVGKVSRCIPLWARELARTPSGPYWLGSARPIAPEPSDNARSDIVASGTTGTADEAPAIGAPMPASCKCGCGHAAQAALAIPKLADSSRHHPINRERHTADGREMQTEALPGA